MLLLVLGLLGGQTVESRAVVARTATAAHDGELSVAGLYAQDDLTSERRGYGEVRARFDGEGMFGAPGLGLHLDLRLRLRMDEVDDRLADLSRAFVGYRAGAFFASLGRIPITPLLGARVDGLELGLHFADGARFSLFGGLAPHPISGTLTPDFVLAGGGLVLRGPSSDVQSGLALQTYQGALDRLWLTSHGYWRLGAEWITFGSLVLDFLAPRGLLGDLADRALAEQSALERVDLSQAQVLLRYLPSPALDLSVSAQHFHTLLPNKWWQDWLESERQRRGFTLDGPEPVGTRRTSAKLLANVHVANWATPYAQARYDRRHGALPGEGGDDGYELLLGVKLRGLESGYLDLSFAQRRLYQADSRLGAANLGVVLGELVSLDGWATLMSVRPLSQEERLTTVDLGGALGLELGRLLPELDGLRLMSQYQCFIEPEIVLQMFYAQLAYRIRS